MSSYVTRRLLRSTLPGSKDAEEKPQDAERKPTASCGSRTRDDRRKKARRDAAKAREAGSEPEAPPVGEERADGGASALHGFELMVDVNYAKELWAQARVLDLDADKQEVFVHYMGWNARYDAWVGPKLVAPHGSRTKCATKKKTSWDGKRSLFAPVGGSTPKKAEGSSKHRSHRRSTTPRAKTDKRKRRGSAGSATSDGKRDGLTPASPTCTRENEDATEKEEGADLAPRVTRARASKASTSSSDQGVEEANAQSRASPSSKRVATPEEEADGDSVCNIEEIPIGNAVSTTNGGAGRVLRRQAAGKRRGRGRKGQEDESSESEYSNHEDSDAEEEDDASDEEEVRRLRKRRKQMELGLPVDDDDEDEDEDEEASDGPATRKRPTARRSERRAGSTKTHPLPRSAPRVSVSSLGDGGATREHLAAIFRQRVFQQQLMQVTRAEMQLQQPPSSAATAPVAPAPAPAAAPSAARTRSRRGGSQSGGKAKAAATVAAPTAVPDPQLAAYYHYHNMMVAQAYMSADPKEIQERMRAIEQQRVLQLQAYYRHLEAARAQNVKSVEDTQEFMSKSASVWQQQQSQAAKSEDEKPASEGSTGLEDGNSTSESLENEKTAATGSDSPRDASVQGLVDASGTVKTCTKEGAGTCQADVELKGEPDAPRGDILYEFVL